MLQRQFHFVIYMDKPLRQSLQDGCTTWWWYFANKFNIWLSAWEKVQVGIGEQYISSYQSVHLLRHNLHKLTEASILLLLKYVNSVEPDQSVLILICIMHAIVISG